jgi:hypothetical protein
MTMTNANRLQRRMEKNIESARMLTIMRDHTPPGEQKWLTEAELFALYSEAVATEIIKAIYKDRSGGYKFGEDNEGNEIVRIIVMDQHGKFKFEINGEGEAVLVSDDQRDQHLAKLLIEYGIETATYN